LTMDYRWRRCNARRCKELSVSREPNELFHKVTSVAHICCFGSVIKDSLSLNEKITSTLFFGRQHEHGTPRCQ
jgi:hypothetical protein